MVVHKEYVEKTSVQINNGSSRRMDAEAPTLTPEAAAFFEPST